MIGHIVQSGIPLPWSHPHCCTIDVESVRLSDLQLLAPFRVLFKGRLPSRFLCSTWEPVSSSRPALLPGRRAQLPSRLAVGERRQRCPLSPGHALTVASTASGYGRLGRFCALLRESGPRD